MEIARIAIYGELLRYEGRDEYTAAGCDNICNAVYRACYEELIIALAGWFLVRRTER